MLQNNYMSLRIPTEDEIASQRELIVVDELPSVEEFVRHFCAERSATPRLIGKLINRVSEIIGDTDYDEEYLTDILEAEYKRHKVL